MRSLCSFLSASLTSIYAFYVFPAFILLYIVIFVHQWSTSGTPMGLPSAIARLYRASNLLTGLFFAQGLTYCDLGSRGLFIYLIAYFSKSCHYLTHMLSSLYCFNLSRCLFACGQGLWSYWMQIDVSENWLVSKTCVHHTYPIYMEIVRWELLTNVLISSAKEGTKGKRRELNFLNSEKRMQQLWKHPSRTGLLTFSVHVPGGWALPPGELGYILSSTQRKG